MLSYTVDVVMFVVGVLGGVIVVVVIGVVGVGVGVVV